MVTRMIIGEEAVDPNTFKQALAKFTTGITVISTKHKSLYHGFTANSFNSVSLKPPLISFCHSKEAGSLEAFSKSNFFGISILADNQIEISKHFATKMTNKFKNIEYSVGKYTGAPLINEAICWIECNKVDMIKAGDHFIFVGEVIHTKINDLIKKPLIYYNREYKEIS